MDPRVNIEPTVVFKGKGKRTQSTSFVDQATARARRVENETEHFRVDTVSSDVAGEIRNGRVRKGWTQKQLATAVNEKVDVIRAWEAGKAIPNGNLLVKIRRALR